MRFLFALLIPVAVWAQAPPNGCSTFTPPAGVSKNCGVQYSNKALSLGDSPALTYDVYWLTSRGSTDPAGQINIFAHGGKGSVLSDPIAPLTDVGAILNWTNCSGSPPQGFLCNGPLYVPQTGLVTNTFIATAGSIGDTSVTLALRYDNSNGITNNGQISSSYFPWPSTPTFTAIIDEGANQETVTVTSYSSLSYAGGCGGPITPTPCATLAITPALTKNHAAGAYLRVPATASLVNEVCNEQDFLSYLALNAGTSGIPGNAFDIRLYGYSHGTYLNWMAAEVGPSERQTCIAAGSMQNTGAGSTKFSITKIVNWSALPDQGFTSNIYEVCKNQSSGTTDCFSGGAPQGEPSAVAALFMIDDTTIGTPVPTTTNNLTTLQPTGAGPSYVTAQQISPIYCVPGTTGYQGIGCYTTTNSWLLPPTMEIGGSHDNNVGIWPMRAMAAVPLASTTLTEQSTCGGGNCGHGGDFATNPCTWCQIGGAFQNGAFTDYSWIGTGTGQIVSNSSVPGTTPGNGYAQGGNTPWIMEGMLYVPASVTGSSQIIAHPAANAAVWSMSTCSPLCFTAYVQSELGATSNCSGVPISVTNQYIAVRYQHNVNNTAIGAAGTDSCEFWDINGNLLAQKTDTYTCSDPAGGGSCPSANSNGFDIRGYHSDFQFVFVRWCTGATLALGSRTPTAANAAGGAGGCPAGSPKLAWNLDDNLNDSSGASGGPYNGTINTGTAVFTPSWGFNGFKPPVIPVISTLPTRVYSNWIAMKTGASNQLDSTTSYSQSLTNNTVTPTWSLLSGPNTPTFSSTSAAQPTLASPFVVFGDYNFQLLETDADGNTGTVTQHVGAVNYDANGVVIQSNPLVTSLLGPMMAWGQSPWGYPDWWQMHAMQLRQADYAATVNTGYGYQAPGWTTNGGKPQWETPGSGTISFYGNGVGNIYYLDTSLGTTVGVAGCSNVATTCTVTNAGNLDFAELPARVVLYNTTTKVWDDLCISSVAGNILTYCFDPSPLTRNSYVSGDLVLQAKYTGSSTHFLSDSNSPVCPTGVTGQPSLPGPASYSTGTVAVDPGTPTLVTLTGGTWAGPSVQAGEWIQLTGATHSSTPYTFIAKISAIPTTTTITLAKNYTGDALSGLTYSILPAQRTVVAHYVHPIDNIGDALRMVSTSLCMSDTSFYGNPTPTGFGLGNSFSGPSDISGFDGTHYAGKQYSITDTTGWLSNSATAGINFYGEDLSHWALYYRTGLTQALTTAQSISNYWIRSPWGNADGNGFAPLVWGGGVYGAWLSYLTDSGTLVDISDLRGYSKIGTTQVTGVAGNCAYNDTRDVAYAYMGVNEGAINDPDTTGTGSPLGGPWRTYWQSFLPQMKTNDTNCQGSDHSWSNGFNFNTNSGTVGLANNSTAGTSVNDLYPPGCTVSTCRCVGTTDGTNTATVINGSAAVTITSGSVPAGTNTMVLTGLKGGVLFSGSYGSTGSGSGTIQLSVLWPGDTGTVTWMSTPVNQLAVGNQVVFATANTDTADLVQQYQCQRNSPTTFTLNRPWLGSTGSFFYAYSSNLAGFGQSPFFDGIDGGYAFLPLANQTIPALSTYATAYQNNGQAIGQWIHDVGYSSQLQGMRYGAVFQFCTPEATFNASNLTFEAQSGCDQGNNTYGIVAAREENSEAMAAMGQWCLLSGGGTCTGSQKAFMDVFYGSLWGYPPYDVGGVYSDAFTAPLNPADSALSDTAIHGGKWTGFFGGIGALYRYPALRFGGSSGSGGTNMGGNATAGGKTVH